MAESLSIKEVITGQIICEEGMPFDYVYFVLKGEFKVTRKIKMAGVNEPGDEPQEQIKEDLKSTLNAKSKLLYAFYKKHVKDVQEEKCLTKP
jgi:hypothetical protein